jgi:hypothetical protein
MIGQDLYVMYLLKRYFSEVSIVRMYTHTSKPDVAIV